MKLLELEPTFVRREVRPCHVGAAGCSVVSSHSEHEYHVLVLEMAEADGIDFICPKCVADGGHHVLCWRPRVPANISPKPGRWEFHGTGYADLTLVAGSSSIQLMGGCNAHFLIRNGEIVEC